jgi:hypothetical protein
MQRRPSPATAIALLALFFALGGTAIAARHYLITSASQIKPSVLRQLHGSNGAQGPAGAAGPTGPQGSQGPAGSNALSGLTPVTGPQTTIASGKAGSSVATCPAGQHAVSGGGFTDNLDGLDASEMSSDHLSWIVLAGNSSSVSAIIEAFAYCATAGQAIAARTNAAAHARAVREANALTARLTRLQHETHG